MTRMQETVLPLVRKYNAAVIGLTLDDDGIPTPDPGDAGWPPLVDHG